SKWLNITTRTYRNYKTKDVSLKDNTKEQIVLLISLYKHGLDVFMTKEDFEHWLTTPNILLDNKAPMDFLDTVSGLKFIDNRLTAMEFGENV
ncbi:MbcA/ParS/Xre antitoxin family protein, partial [Algoriella sp.]